MKSYAILLSFSALIAAPAQASVVLYSNDFQSGVATGWSGDVTSVATAPNTAPDGAEYKFLGLFERKGSTINNPQGVPVFSSLNVATKGFNQITVSFDLYTIGGIDGDNFFSFVAGGTSLIDATFSNIFPYPQTFGGPDSVAGTGSDPTLNDRFGYSPLFGDKTYRLSFVVPTSSENTTFSLGGRSSRFGDGAFGVDNFKVVGLSVGAVPEPATWAMMLFGFGLIGGMMRSDRRRRLTFANGKAI